MRWRPTPSLFIMPLWRIDFVARDPWGEYVMARVEDARVVDAPRIVAAPCEAGHPAPAEKCDCGLYASPNWVAVCAIAQKVAQDTGHPVIISLVAGRNPAYIADDELTVRASVHMYVKLGPIVLPSGKELKGRKARRIRQALAERLARAAS